MKQIINPAGGPGAVGPYSPAIKSNGLVFVSGQIPLDPASGELVGGDIQAQVRRVRIPVKPATQSGESGHPVGAKRRWGFHDVSGGRFESM